MSEHATTDRRTTTPVHVIGGGVAGLVAAISAAEAGAPTVLHEASAHVGGRAHSGHAGFGVNLGPHIVCTDGALHRFLARRSIAPELRRGPLTGNVIVSDDRLHRVPPFGLVRRSVTQMFADAAPDERFDTWAAGRMGEREAAMLGRYAGLITFHHDPGSLSAQFVWERFRRVFFRPDRVRSVAGGWVRLVDRLTEHARHAGVVMELGAPMTAADLPDDGPVIVTTGLAVASQLLGEPLAWSGARTALLDVALRSEAGRPCLAVDVSADLRTCCFVDRVTGIDPSLAPPGIDLVQTQLGIAGDVEPAAAVARIERSLDVAMPGWRGAEEWRRELVVTGSSGAVDPPGSSWRDRPAIDRGGGRFLAGDMTAAPGLLSEVSVNSAVRAAQLALEDRRQRSFAPGWPSVALSPSARVGVLAASLPTTAVRDATVPHPLDHAWNVEPQEETEPYFRLQARRWHTVAVGAAPAPDGRGTDVRVLVGTRLADRRPVRWVLDRLARRELRRRTTE